MGELSRSSRQVSTSTTTFPTTIEMNSSDESSSEPEKSKSTAAADEEDEDEDDPWADVDDDDETMLKSGKLNIVDQMRQLREQGRYIPYELTTNHMNETISRVVSAYEILDQYYLPSRETWEKLLGLVTGLDVTVQPECFASYFQGVSGFRGYETWAYRFLDVRGRFPESGTLHGKFSSFGEWDECFELESPQSSSTGLTVKSQYCMLEVKIPYPVVNNLEELKQVVDVNHPWFMKMKKYLRNFRLHNLFTPYKLIELLQMTNGTIYRAGLCIPHLCKQYEIENLIQNLTYPIFRMPLQLGPKCYKIDDPVKFKPHQLVAATLITALVAFVILCTIIEFYNINYDRTTAKNNLKLGNVMFQHDLIMKPNLFLYSFSMITNSRSLLKHSRFSSLDSMKFLFMIYIHLYNYFNLQSTIGFVSLKRIFTTYPALAMRSDRYTWFRTTLPFEPIFIISGLVVGFNIHQKLKGSFTKNNYLLYVARLWAQFAATYIGSVFFIYLLPVMNRAPVWENGMSWLDGCLNPQIVLNGLLFISNYNVQMGSMGGRHSPILPMCNPPTWMTSALIQLLVIAPIIVYIAYQLSKRGAYIFFMSIIIIGFLMNLLPFIVFGIKPDVHFLEFETLYETILSHSWYRYGTQAYIGCFLMGIMAGYLLVDFKILLRFEIETTVLVVSFILIQISIAVNNVFWRLDRPPSLILSLTWYTLIRFLGSVGFTGIFFLIASNRCSLFNRLLDWSPLRSISRLAYSYFMVHILIVFYRIFSTKDVQSMTDSMMLQNFAIDVMFTLLLAYLFYCMVECPCVNILNWSQGKIFFDVEHVQQSSNEKSTTMMMMTNGGDGHLHINNNISTATTGSLDQLATTQQQQDKSSALKNVTNNNNNIGYTNNAYVSNGDLSSSSTSSSSTPPPPSINKNNNGDDQQQPIQSKEDVEKC
ncbi:uncharacterized protein LOC124491224 isoform X3 [Dermatophagoides farinae]